MCTLEAKVMIMDTKINTRSILQPTCNRIPKLDRRNSIKKISSSSSSSSSSSQKSIPPPPPLPIPLSENDDHVSSRTSLLSSSISEKVNVVITPRVSTRSLERKKSKSFKEGVVMNGGMNVSNSSMESSLSYSSSLIVESPGSIAAVRREHMALQQAQRKMRIAHYGRSKSANFEANGVSLLLDNTSITTHSSINDHDEEKRCSFITPNSDPIYVVYHDEEWGVPVHDDKMLFELLVLSGAQVGSDWTSILKKRHVFRNAFWDFDAEKVGKLTDKQMLSISSDYGIEISRIRGVVDNSIRILEVRKEFGSFEKYIWGFVNHKTIATNYKFGYKIQVKTSKSESISKDMVRRGFRFVGPTVVHSFMQAAGLTNDHLITCHRHHPCSLTTLDPTPA